MNNTTRHRSWSRQAGVTLVEALVALLVMSIGMVALVGQMGNLRYSTDVAKQRSEAMRIAQAQLGLLRAFSTVTKPNGAPPPIRDYDNDIVTPPEPFVSSTPNSNATFIVNRAVTPVIPGDNNLLAARTVQVDVSWTDRANTRQTLALESIIARVDPAYGGAIAFAAPTPDARIPSGQHPAIPVAARDLGNKTSAFRPSDLASTVWVFNNVTGVIVSTCQISVGTALTVDAVSSANCTPTTAYLLSGTVRFSSTNPANPTQPEAGAQSLGVTAVQTVGAAAPSCFNDSPSSPAAPQSFVNYSCIVYPAADTGGGASVWTGQVLLGTPLVIGTTSTEFRVCRYSADYNGNGKIDNAEHPATYTKLSGSLARQNFLVVRGNVDCPSAPAVNLSTGVYANYSTAQHQPAP